MNRSTVRQGFGTTGQNITSCLTLQTGRLVREQATPLLPFQQAIVPTLRKPHGRLIPWKDNISSVSFASSTNLGFRKL